MKNMVPTFGRNQPKEPDAEFVKKVDYDAKVLEIENSIKEKASKDELPAIPDHSIYLEEKHLEPFAKKEDLEEYALKKDIPKSIDTSNFATKDQIPKDYLTKKDLPDPIDISNLVKKEDVEKFATKDQLPDLTTYLKKSELPPEKDLSEYAKKSDLDGLIAKDCVDLRPYAKKDDLNEYVKKGEIPTPQYCYCMVKLKSDFRIYDGTDWAFEFYMGNRGDWHTIHDTEKSLQRPEEFVFYMPFKGIASIDFCFTCRKDTHILKPRALQRIRTSDGEFINFQYHDTSPETAVSPQISTLTFRNRVELRLEQGAWIKFSMEFDNRLHNHKKQWLHAVGSDGGFTPTYFSITGIKLP